MGETEKASRIVSYDGYELYAGSHHSRPKDLIPWVQQFCSKRENNWYVVIEFRYLNDVFNYHGIKHHIPNFHLSHQMITDHHSKEWNYLSDEDVIEIHEQAKQLYGLIHARWVCSPRGLELMKRKVVEKNRYGFCPRHHCFNAPLIPVGLSPEPNRHSAKLFCTCCADIYKPPEDKRIDGAHFGPCLPAVFLVAYPEHDKRGKCERPVQKFMGFKIKNCL